MPPSRRREVGNGHRGRQRPGHRERLGYDGSWIRQRHREHGVGSAAVFLAAAGRRTERVELGTAVIPIGDESPFRLDLIATTAKRDSGLAKPLA
ncbi:LLM class flavin-dependent oxidoreductase [Streptomyces bungoensis]|uniref:LLM class flavin-dependent oxidoreductase n=1 Tax=Streptomyces bungoensis TaxID=285568 RepID=UPI0036AE1D0C